MPGASCESPAAWASVIRTTGASADFPGAPFTAWNVQERPLFVSSTRSVASPRSVATIFTSPVDGWLNDETIMTGPWNAVVSSERSSFFGSSAAESDSTMVRSSGREMAWRALPEMSMRAKPPCWAKRTSAIFARGAASAAAVFDPARSALSGEPPPQGRRSRRTVDGSRRGDGAAFAGPITMPCFTRFTS